MCIARYPAQASSKTVKRDVDVRRFDSMWHTHTHKHHKYMRACTSVKTHKVQSALRAKCIKLYRVCLRIELHGNWMLRACARRVNKYVLNGRVPGTHTHTHIQSISFISQRARSTSSCLKPITINISACQRRRRRAAAELWILLHSTTLRTGLSHTNAHTAGKVRSFDALKIVLEKC